jgi:hypothetical protein
MFHVWHESDPEVQSNPLAGGTVNVKDYYKGALDPKSGKLAGGASMMQVLVNRSAFCMQVCKNIICTSNLVAAE